jgi:hypothetical protein
MIDDILKDHGQKAVSQIQQNLADTGTDATKKTSESVRYEVVSQGTTTILTVIGGREYFPAVETGSKPAKTEVPPKEMIDSLKEWVQVRGMEGAEWAVAKTILKKGSALWQKGGRKDIFTNVKNDMLEPLKKDIQAFQKDAILKALINPVKL